MNNSNRNFFLQLCFTAVRPVPAGGILLCDEELNMVATELDSFDGRKDPERCTALVNQLRMSQDKVLYSSYTVLTCNYLNVVVKQS